MASNSFTRDLFELTLGEMSNRWKITLSESDFQRLKASAGDASRSILLACAGNGAPLSSGNLSGKIITRIIIGVYGTGVAEVDFQGTEDFNPGTTEIKAGCPGTLDITGIEQRFTGISVAQSTGTPDLFLAVWGYTPPSTT